MTKDTRAVRARLSAYHDLAETMRGLEADLRWGLTDSLRIPQAWREIATRPDVPQKKQVTIRLDEDVLTFFRAMGRGHLTRINAVLRTFMCARLADVIAGPMSVHYGPTFEEELKQLRREILDTVDEELSEREIQKLAMKNAAVRKARIATLKQLRDRRRVEQRDRALVLRTWNK